MAKILYSKDYVEKKTKELNDKIIKIGFSPVISIIRIGQNAGSISYEKGINKSAKKLGVEVDLNVYDKDVSQDEVIEKIKELNEDERVGGILIFRPLPEKFSEEEISLAIDPKKDIDCMSPINMAKVYTGDVDGFIPLAPRACYELLKYYDYELKGKDAVIINHSNVVGKPLAMILLKEWMTVTICHINTVDLKKHTKNADIVFTAIGKAEFFDESYFNENATVIDIGTSRNSEGKLCGDLDEKSVHKKIKAYSPVPGGIGSITNLLLLENVINYYL